MIDPGLTSLEIVGIAIKSEIEAAQVYDGLVQKVKLSPPPRSLLPKVDIALSEKTPVPDLLEVAMEREKLSEEFYADFARRAEDSRGRAMLQYLSKMEGSHYHLLKTELDFISQFPDYYKVEEFHFGDEMVHLGP